MSAVFTCPSLVRNHNKPLVFTNHALTPLQAQEAPQTPALPLGAIFTNPNTEILLEAVSTAHRPVGHPRLVSASANLQLLSGGPKSYSHGVLAQIQHLSWIPGGLSL